LSPPSASSQNLKALTRRLDARIDSIPWNRQLWGIALVDERGRLLYGRNPDRMFIPASNTKLVVSAVASALLPPEWKVRTSVYGAGPVVGGTVAGDLVLYGRGDPTMTVHCYATDTTLAGVCDQDPFQRLRELADSLQAHGVRGIAGDLVGDGSYFTPEIVHPAWEGYDLNWWYAAPVSGLGFNDNSINLKWGPGPLEDAPGTLTVFPELGDVHIENRSRTVAPGTATTMDFFREPGTLTLWMEGTVAADSPGGTEYFALPDPNLFTARAFRTALAERGISVLGTTRSTTDSLRYAAVRASTPLGEVESRPLRDWVFPILNTSQNWFADMLLKQLGRQFGRSGSWHDGIEVERRFLIDSVKADSTQFALSDGSGLASSNLVSPLTFTQILQFIRRHPRYPTFQAGLPQSGNTGSLRKRFVDTPLEGRVRAKTGSISRVNTISGYIELADGRVLTFSVQANHHDQPSRSILAELDSVVVDMGTMMGKRK
jgi:D-alanyl-D-alanine carboxypeptidase/D-alanyl-D-alanine-endopeptidase (penicillin-binding protein 4)